MYKLKNKQLIHLTKGKYHDGGGLYIRITRQEAKITHFHEDAGNGSAIVVLLCRMRRHD